MQLTIPVFISSKQAEFVIERDLMADKIRGLPPLDPVIAEEWAPQARRVQEVMLSKVRASPIYVGLFSSIYSEPTELEYREAALNPYRELLVYVKAGVERDPRLTSLIEHMQEHHYITRFTDVRDLLHKFSAHLQECVSRMILLLQTLGEAQPVSRGGGSHLAARWQEQNRLLNQFGFSGLEAAQRQELLELLSRAGEVAR